MKVLFLAPQAFFIERGTPIAVRLALGVIAERLKHGAEGQIDLLCYHEGAEVEIKGVKIFRITPPGFLQKYLVKIGPGISVKKLICDVLFLFKALSLVRQSRRAGDSYKVVHAVEESVFIALLAKYLYGIPYIYDMDSSLAMQVTEKWAVLKPLFGILNFFERLAVKNSMAVAPVCDSLGLIATKHGSKNTFILRDISLLKFDQETNFPSLRSEFDISAEKKIILYVGNLEVYQGIDLLIESFQIYCSKDNSADLVIIGGSTEHILKYKKISEERGIGSRVFFAGSRPLDNLAEYLGQADILVSPRIKGNNTPMKIYSYLHSGKALLATDLPTHTQVLTPQIAALAGAEPNAYSAGLLKLVIDDNYRLALASAAKIEAEEKFTLESFKAQLNRLYDSLC